MLVIASSYKICFLYKITLWLFIMWPDCSYFHWSIGMSWDIKTRSIHVWEYYSYMQKFKDRNLWVTHQCYILRIWCVNFWVKSSLFLLLYKSSKMLAIPLMCMRYNFIMVDLQYSLVLIVVVIGTTSWHDRPQADTTRW